MSGDESGHTFLKGASVFPGPHNSYPLPLCVTIYLSFGDHSLEIR